tara:strand:- start:632 stop:814 length:183 start_codon:yes stop_codon:yes gene_type:complete
MQNYLFFVVGGRENYHSVTRAIEHLPTEAKPRGLSKQKKIIIKISPPGTPLGPMETMPGR